ncbi:hypothetical protein COLO4_14925 [Corchorus olitorius]|uniref:Uncharacterized protein n=1 Tax=Corchorus olitorius TaxID=93759 RepID=A0A1R3JQI3_9ROSI|nr:hypothetical protein COLO4_14925 [Corchorus olitorius]
MLIGFDLTSYIDGTPAPPTEIQEDEAVLPLVSSSNTSREAWQTLSKMFANKSRSRVMDLKNTLTSTKRKCPPIKASAAVKMAQIDIQMVILARPPMMMVPIQAIAWSAKL